MKKGYLILVIMVTVWVASLTLILVPTIGTTSVVVPPPPVEQYKLTFLLASACVAAGYSAYLGMRNIFKR